MTDRYSVQAESMQEIAKSISAIADLAGNCTKHQIKRSDIESMLQGVKQICKDSATPRWSSDLSTTTQMCALLMMLGALMTFSLNVVVRLNKLGAMVALLSSHSDWTRNQEKCMKLVEILQKDWTTVDCLILHLVKFCLRGSGRAAKADLVDKVLKAADHEQREKMTKARMAVGLRRISPQPRSSLRLNENHRASLMELGQMREQQEPAPTKLRKPINSRASDNADKKAKEQLSRESNDALLGNEEDTSDKSVSYMKEISSIEANFERRQEDIVNTFRSQKPKGHLEKLHAFSGVAALYELKKQRQEEWAQMGAIRPRTTSRKKSQ